MLLSTPTPILNRGISVVPTHEITLRIPLCVPAEPLSLYLIAPGCKSISSYTIIASLGEKLYQPSSSRTLSPDRFIYVSGLAITVLTPRTYVSHTNA